MAKFLFRVICFLVFTAFIYVVGIIFFANYSTKAVNLNIAVERLPTGAIDKRLKEVDTIQNIDILFLGSSRSYRGFDTRIFKQAGYSTFNLGTSAQTPVQTKVLLKRYLARLNPKLIVYEVSAGTLKSESLNPSLQLLTYDEIDIYNLEMALAEEDLLIFNTMIYNYFHGLFGLKNNVEEDTKKDKMYVTGGYVVTQSTEFKDYKGGKLAHYQDTNNQSIKIETFDENLSYINSLSIPVILVNAPSKSDFYDKWLVDRKVDSIFTERGNYYNYNDNFYLNTDNQYFSNPTHLNQKGVERFNKDLIENVIDPFFKRIKNK